MDYIVLTDPHLTTPPIRFTLSRISVDNRMKQGVLIRITIFLLWHKCVKKQEKETQREPYLYVRKVIKLPLFDLPQRSESFDELQMS